MHEMAFETVKIFRCLACNKKPIWKKAIAHHSVPWGHGDVWCSEKCLNSGKEAKPDKRRTRRFRRRHEVYIKLEKLSNFNDIENCKHLDNE